MKVVLPRRGHGPLCLASLRHALVLSLLGIVLWVTTAPVAHAQELYEWREAGGTTVYSQTPPRPSQGVVQRRLKLADWPADQRAAATRALVRSAPPGDAKATALQHADARLTAALARAQAAERALALGQEPRPGEHRHLVNGHSRLTQAYFERLKSLEVTATRERASLQAAYAARDALTGAR